MDLNPKNTAVLEAVRKSAQYGAPCPVTREAVQRVIDDHVTSVIEKCGYAKNEAEVTASFLKTDTGKLLYNALTRADTPNDPEPQPLMPTRSAAFDKIAAKAQKIERTEGITEAEAVVKALQSDATLYTEFLLAQAGESCPPIESVPNVSKGDKDASEIQQLLKLLNSR